MSKMHKKKQAADRFESTRKDVSSQADSQALHQQYSVHDLFWIMVGVIFLFILGYVVIHFDIVSIETFTSAMSKYNVTTIAQSGVTG